MVTVLLVAVAIFLSGVLAFWLLLKNRERELRLARKARKFNREWNTVFERTDLRKVEA